MLSYPLVSTSNDSTEGPAIDNSAVVQAFSGGLFFAATLAARMAGGLLGTAAAFIALPLMLAGRRSGPLVSDGLETAPLQADDLLTSEAIHQMPQPDKPMDPIAEAVRELEK